MGGHRIQRVPPTERRGRVHTSTITVSVLDPDAGNDDERLQARAVDDFKVEWYSGSGAGGQHRNKHQNSCRLTHLPTGIVRTAQTRSRTNSYKLAMDDLVNELDALLSNGVKSDRARLMREQVGSGMRGDKRRTYRFQEDKVVDHETGKSASANKVLRGNFDLLW